MDADNERERRIIDAAYGLVLGAFEAAPGDDARGNAKWQDPDVQAAAIDVARAFLSKIEQLK